MSPFEFFGRSAATRCFSVRAVQLPRCFSCGQGSAAFRSFSGQQASRRCQVGGRHLPTVSYGQSYKQTYSDTGFSRANGLCTLGPHSFSPHSAGRFSSNSCSAALICVFVLREEFAFLFQTFSRSDPPGKAPPTRGRYV